MPADVFREFESFLQAELNDTKHQKRATELIAYAAFTAHNKVFDIGSTCFRAIRRENLWSMAICEKHSKRLRNPKSILRF